MEREVRTRKVATAGALIALGCELLDIEENDKGQGVFVFDGKAQTALKRLQNAKQRAMAERTKALGRNGAEEQD